MRELTLYRGFLSLKAAGKGFDIHTVTPLPPPLTESCCSAAGGADPPSTWSPWTTPPPPEFQWPPRIRGSGMCEWHFSSSPILRPWLFLRPSPKQLIPHSVRNPIWPSASFLWGTWDRLPLLWNTIECIVPVHTGPTSETPHTETTSHNTFNIQIHVYELNLRVIVFGVRISLTEIYLEP